MTEAPSGAAFHLPDLGEGLTEATIVSWLVSAGDHVVADQPLVTVETDKAIVDIPSPHAGQILTLEAEAGAIVQVGQILVTISSSDAVPAAHDRGAVVGDLPETPAPEATSTLKASPRARQRARDLNVDLATVTASGPDGVIQAEDVERPATTPVAGQLGGVRRAMARRMTDAHARVARATVTDEADVSGWYDGHSPLLRLVRAVGIACRTHPLLNARFDDLNQVLTEQPTVNLGIAMETEDGLFAPVLEDVNSQSASALEAEIARLEQAVITRRIKPDQLSGQTITLSNFGAVGGLHAEMIVVPPQVAIVGAGRVFERYGPGGAQSTRLPLSISFDHRVVTGVEACEFLSALTDDLEQTA
jgi:pyruvate dehydrogenase E2 component (dihydrolipoamide acetyltransferase)